jgi:hypothetical protein
LKKIFNKSHFADIRQDFCGVCLNEVFGTCAKCRCLSRKGFENANLFCSGQKVMGNVPNLPERVWKPCNSSFTPVRKLWEISHTIPKGFESLATFLSAQSGPTQKGAQSMTECLFCALKLKIGVPSKLADPFIHPIYP